VEVWSHFPEIVLDVFLRGERRLLVTANVVPIPLILVTFMEALPSSETSVLTRVTIRHPRRRHSSSPSV
jgi:hypothetical protein